MIARILRYVLAVAVVAVIAVIGGLTFAAVRSRISASATPTATPTPKPKPTPTPTHRHRPRPRPTPTRPVGTIPASGISLVYMRVTSTVASPGQPITLSYTVNNLTGQARLIFLGATIVSDSIPGQSFSDPRDDVVITSQPGTNVYARTFLFPIAAAGQTFDLLASVADPTTKQAYQLLRLNHFFTVGPT